MTSNTLKSFGLHWIGSGCSSYGVMCIRIALFVQWGKLYKVSILLNYNFLINKLWASEGLPLNKFLYSYFFFFLIFKWKRGSIMQQFLLAPNNMFLSWCTQTSRWRIFKRYFFLFRWYYKICIIFLKMYIL